MTTKLPQQTVQKKGFTFRDLTPYLYIVPSLALFILFVFYPFVKTIYLSLSSTDLNGNATGFVGFANYITAFQDKTMWTAL